MTSARTPGRARTVEELLTSAGPAKYLGFWGHSPPASGGVSAACLSQWWPADFTVAGVVYPTSEHYVMAAKARLFGDTAA